MRVQFRRLTEADLPKIMRMNQDFRQGFADPEATQRFLQNPANWFFAALWEETVIGFAYGYALPRLNDSKNMLYLHEVGVAQGLDAEVVEGLRAHFQGECTEVGMYLAMARVAEREGYPEVAEAYKRYAFEEAEHAAKFAELLGEVVTTSTKKNLELRVAAETGACEGKLAIAKRAKELGYDAIHDTVHEMAKDEARHGAGFNGLLNRYFK